jgi:hypothetical protein
MHSRRTRIIVGALLGGLALAASACGSSAGDQLLVAGDTSAQEATSTNIWAVTPGDPLGSSSVVSKGVTSPLGISTVEDDGLVWTNQLGREWQGQPLLSFEATSSGNAVAKVTSADPGGKVVTIDSSTAAAIQPVVLRRGVAVISQDGCKLATAPDDVTSVGKGSCQISADERWVISWDANTPGPLTIKDLRTGDSRKVGSKTYGASIIDVDSRILSVEQSGQGLRGVVYDASSGKEIGHTKTYGRMVAFPGTAGATGFVALAQSGDASQTSNVQLLWISPDGGVSVIDSGLSLYPVMVNGQVTYIRFDASESRDSIRRWTPGGGSDAREVLLTGRVGAAQVAPNAIIATKDSSAGVAFYRTAGSGELEHAFDLTTKLSGGSTVDKLLVLDDTAFMQVTTDQRTSFVRLPLHGDGAVAPMKAWAYLTLESVDVDGTALVTGNRTDGSDSGREQLLVVGPYQDKGTVRATAARTGVDLIHEGVVYWTDQPTQGQISVRSVRATGDEDAKVLYQGHQVAGATWPENNGATESTLVSRVALIQQQQQQQQAQGDTGSGTGDTGDGTSAGGEGTGDAGTGAATTP